jgi:alkylated DNA repair dioxygenase AlkB
MQGALFTDADAAVSMEGLRYQADFLSGDEEAGLLDIVRSLPLRAARYKEYTARRRVVSFGGAFDYDDNVLRPGEPLDEWLMPLRDRVAAWLDLSPDALAHALVAEYTPGTPLGWHRDVPDFEMIAGISLGSEATLRFRPYPPSHPHAREVHQLPVAPRSIYKMAGPARWNWQHCVPPVKALRWSITFRTRRLLSNARAH